MFISVDDDELLTSSPSCVCVSIDGGLGRVCVQEVRKKSLPFPFTLFFFYLFIIWALPYFLSNQMDCVELQLAERNRFFYTKIFLHTFEFDEGENPSKEKFVDTFFSSISDVCAAHVDTHRETLSPTP